LNANYKELVEPCASSLDVESKEGSCDASSGSTGVEFKKCDRCVILQWHAMSGVAHETRMIKYLRIVLYDECPVLQYVREFSTTMSYRFWLPANL